MFFAEKNEFLSEKSTFLAFLRKGKIEI